MITQKTIRSSNAHLAFIYYAPAASHVFGGGFQIPDGMLKLTDAPQQEKGKRHALVVDDAPDVAEMISMFLQHTGYRVTTAFSAFDALSSAQAEKFDVVVSDIGMPGMSGYDLAVALRSLDGYEAVPMVAVTGFSMYDDRDRALSSGFDAFLSKPINPMTLLDLIERLCA